MCQADNTTAYIRSHFLTLAELADGAGCEPTRIEEFIDYKCMPRHSYEIVATAVVRSFFGERTMSPTRTRYFSPALAAWAREVEQLSDSQTLEEVAQSQKEQFFGRYRQLLVELEAQHNGFETHFDTAGDLDESSINEHLEEEWQHVLDGTYALCTRTSRVDAIVEKEVMAQKIKRLTEDNTRANESLTDHERRELSAAVQRLDAVCSPFAPDELERSTRHHRIDCVVRRYALDLGGPP